MNNIQNANERNHRIDNIRFILIFLVVFGHLLGIMTGSKADLLYRFIYSFHMPVFIFITGCYARFKPGKILLGLIYPYFLFQTLYLAFYIHVLGGAADTLYSYTTPYWILWYLLVTTFYYLLIPMLQQKKLLVCLAVLAGCSAVSLLSGFEMTADYFLSLARFLCYLPFFVAGYYWGNCRQLLPQRLISKKTKLVTLILCALFLILAQLFILRYPNSFSRQVLYNAYCYKAAGYGWKQRALVLAVGLAWVVVLLIATPRKKLWLVSSLGKNAMPIFLFHGFIVKLMEKYSLFRFSEPVNLLLALGITAALVCLFGNPVAAWVCKWFFTGHWITALVQLIQNKIASRKVQCH